MKHVQLSKLRMPKDNNLLSFGIELVFIYIVYRILSRVENQTKLLMFCNSEAYNVNKGLIFTKGVKCTPRSDINRDRFGARKWVEKSCAREKNLSIIEWNFWNDSRYKLIGPPFHPTDHVPIQHTHLYGQQKANE